MYSNNTYLKPLDQFQWFLFFVSLQHGTTLYPSVPDLDLEIRGTQSSIPLDKGGGGGLQIKFFRPFRPQFGLKIRGDCTLSWICQCPYRIFFTLQLKLKSDRTSFNECAKKSRQQLVTLVDNATFMCHW